MNHLEKYNFWCTSEYFDNKTKNELLSIKDNQKEINDRFYKELEFGTGGLRGLLGAGSNRMNIYTVRKATQGIAEYINKTVQNNKSVAIAYDSRNMSKEFAKETALCFNANGIKTYLFTALRPTPELSFAVRHLNCTAGIDEATGNVVVRVSKEFYRPAEVELLIGDSTKAKETLGWTPKVNLKGLVECMVKNDLEIEK